MSLPELPQELARFTPSEGQHNALKMFVQAYGQLCRKQALEEAAALVDANADRCVASTFVPEMILRSNADAIRGLI